MMMKLLLLLLAAVAVVAMAEVNVTEILEMEDQWLQWKEKHGKSYSPKEEMYRRLVFYKNLEDVKEHNSRYPVHVTFTKGLNQFSDMTVEEYRSYNWLKPLSRSGAKLGSCQSPPYVRPRSTQVQETIDWRKMGYVTPVKNQGHCGSSWAFSATGSVEGQHFRKTLKLVSLSEQQLVDCSKNDWNDGCHGGFKDIAFDYIINQPNGLESEKDYPYAAATQNCSANSSLEQAPISGCVDIASGDEWALVWATNSVGPISVVVNANHDSFKSYRKGVYVQDMCDPDYVTHGMLVVGYGNHHGKKYWILKNSWGTDWGMHGYMMMGRYMENMCGVATMASYPTV